MKNQEAIDSFVCTIGKIYSLLDELKTYVVDEHMEIPPKEIGWEHVERVKQILKMLDEAAVFISIQHGK